MGLDMYLYKKTYVKYWEHNGDNNYEITITKNGKPVDIDTKNISYLVEQVGYWRKANQVHQWFVENVQEGNDNCGSYYVSRENLLELLDMCNQVLEKKEMAEELLPSHSGFFFGGTDYDEWYFEQLDETKKIIESCLADEHAHDFMYSSSW
jgi:hypothetical protein